MLELIIEQWISKKLEVIKSVYESIPTLVSQKAYYIFDFRKSRKPHCANYIFKDTKINVNFVV